MAIATAFIVGEDGFKIEGRQEAGLDGKAFGSYDE